MQIFRPFKVWASLAVLSLMFGIGVGNHFANQPDPVSAYKMNKNVQAYSFNFLGGSKQGVVRARVPVSYLTAKDANPLEHEKTPQKEGVKQVCFLGQQTDEDPLYSGEMVEVKITEDIQAHDEFRVEIYVENTGNMIWYGVNSKCDDRSFMNLGTWKEQDRSSVFFYDPEDEDSGWIGDNRVAMVEDIARPGETATFAFTSKAPDRDTIWREYFNLVLEGEMWVDGTEVAVDIPVGNYTEEDAHMVQFLMEETFDTASLEGDPHIEVELSTQTMRLMYGEQVAYELPVSSGKAKTPTPRGTWHVLNKQELRVGGDWPHYHMPYWMGFTRWGHGMHALPYLANDGGAFWYEALNHIGIPVSHGCIRMLPDDAVTVYEFGEVGMELKVY